MRLKFYAISSSIHKFFLSLKKGHNHWPDSWAGGVFYTYFRDAKWNRAIFRFSDENQTL